MIDYQRVELAVEPFHDTQLLRFVPLTEVRGFVHAVTTRPWNMAAHQGPERERAIARRRMICEHLGLPFERLTAPDQVHSPHVLRVQESDVGSGRDGRESALRFVDGLICDIVGVPIIQFSADCPLLLVVEPNRRILGTAHASWRGTVSGIAMELIRQMHEEFGIVPNQLLTGICPCAGAGEYDVGEDVYRIARARLGDVEPFFPTRDGRRYFDLGAANVAQLIMAGVPAKQIWVANASTMTDERFFSHRRDGPETGRFAIIAGFTSTS